ncbi:MAG: endolytic transglycosylase MltG [Ruminococcaceae bacterium]|nr:endolytic transglycosylase MltG [Oscillospiraceae bacterium]
MNENKNPNELNKRSDMQEFKLPAEPGAEEFENVEDLIASVMKQIEESKAQTAPLSSSDTIVDATRIQPKEQPVHNMDETVAFSTPAEPAMEGQTRVIPAAQPQEPVKEVKKPKKKKRRMSAAQRALLYVFGVVTAAVLIAVGVWYCALDVLALTKPDREVSVTISETDSVADVANTLYDNGLIEYKWLFRLYCAFANADEKIDPGVYTLNNLFDYHALVNGLIGTAPTRDTATVMIPEGYECEQIYALMEEKGICSAEELADCAANHVFDYDFLSHLDYGDPSRLEGYLFPDTYDFYVNEDPVNVLSKLLKNYERRVSDELLAQIDALNETLREKMSTAGFSEEEINAAMMDEQKIIIVASLIEKETAGSSESAKIASVIYNRLCSKVYPCLQIDATIQYVLEERKDVLTNSDLAINSPYNTYLNPGLTPGPIANPGLNSIKAALSPADTTYYFYALDKDGSHHFSSSYYEHRDFLEGLEE